jgi:hypothetical protein
LRDEQDAQDYHDAGTTGDPLTKSTGDQVGGQSDHSEKEQSGDESGLPEDDEQDWEEQEALKGASEGGDDAELDKRLSDDQEQ